MSDIVERLRACDCGTHCKAGCIQEKAADEIERLRAHKRAQAEDIMTLGQQVGRLEAVLAAERAARIAVASPVRQEGEE